LNFLLSPNPLGSVIDAALSAASEGKFELVLPADVAAELFTTIERRRHLASRIQQADVVRLLQRVLTFASTAPLLEVSPPEISRDPQDDYLLALAVVHEADYLVTRDRDLLDLRDVLRVRIVDPMTFLALLRSTAESS
jgi:putative PIN family toxin of toxin-antitoxin system